MGSNEALLHDIKVVVGNKALMAEEDITIGKAVDEYMRDMEVSPSFLGTSLSFSETFVHSCNPYLD